MEKQTTITILTAISSGLLGIIITILSNKVVQRRKFNQELAMMVLNEARINLNSIGKILIRMELNLKDIGNIYNIDIVDIWEEYHKDEFYPNKGRECYKIDLFKEYVEDEYDESNQKLQVYLDKAIATNDYKINCKKEYQEKVFKNYKDNLELFNKKIFDFRALSINEALLLKSGRQFSILYKDFLKIQDELESFLNYIDQYIEKKDNYKELCRNITRCYLIIKLSLGDETKNTVGRFIQHVQNIYDFNHKYFM